MEGEAVRVGLDGRECIAIGHVVDNRDDGAAAGAWLTSGRRFAAVSLGPDPVADEQRGEAIHLGTAENPAAGVWIPEVKAAGHLAVT